MPAQKYNLPRAQNAYDADAVSIASGVDYEKIITAETDPIRAVQDGSMDINLIVKQAKATGLMPLNTMKPITDAMLDPPEDLGDALRRIDAAYDAFMRLSPEVREKFDNDVVKAQAAMATMSSQQIGELINGRKDTSTPAGPPRTDQVGTVPQGPQSGPAPNPGPPAGPQSGTAGA